jgi:hypothetical protein
MRLPRLALFFLIFLMVAVAAGSAQNIEFSAKAYEAPAFSATFPLPDKDKDGVAFSSQSVSPKSGGTLTLNVYGLEIHSGANSFQVMYTDTPTPWRGDAAALDSMLDGALKQLDNAKPNPKTDATYSGLPARMVTATGTYKVGQNTFEVTTYQRIAVQGNRIWQGIVVCDKRTNCSPADANRFLDSIKIK